MSMGGSYGESAGSTKLADGARAEELWLPRGVDPVRDPDDHLRLDPGVAVIAPRVARVALGLAAVLEGDQLLARGPHGSDAIRTVEAAMELVSGAGFYRDLGLERLFRDIQGARYHPLRAAPSSPMRGAWPSVWT
jgi:hypothetical protein